MNVWHEASTKATTIDGNSLLGRVYKQQLISTQTYDDLVRCTRVTCPTIERDLLNAACHRRFILDNVGVKFWTQNCGRSRKFFEITVIHTGATIIYSKEKVHNNYCVEFKNENTSLIPLLDNFLNRKHKFQRQAKTKNFLNI